ncbi:toll/interleukin-1 receptor domain-containing protein [Paenibacillus sp. 19GGS1-52]|uniref:toll/interleukin-1 receptor domain-containing protein n=1 Tax=Paenibacillus sp. 19GGS1-52 TaxID=2758563 RepID=UPI001EFB885C|nr:toll/interleukin-1 receptor domain-containing protein [Paenibacillus sp. 19GGS1-52]ULO08950.1 toll/interleukin-1 receptor domain-containing protein [Paenibacillus sp. 19GGS1-52]
MQIPKIFISHISEEKALAEILKEEIGKAFLGLPEIFVSSDGESISIGSKWLDEIDQALKDSQIILLLCSESSVTRPWINFEAGAGWVKGIPIIPICHTNLRPVELPIPLNMLQGIQVTNKAGLTKVFEMVGKYLGVKDTPEIQFDRIIEKVRVFEKEYGFIEVVRREVKGIIKLEEELEQVFVPIPSSRRISGFLGDIVVDKLTPHLDVLKKIGVLDYSIGNNKLTMGVAGGNELEIKIEVFQPYYDIANRILG